MKNYELILRPSQGVLDLNLSEIIEYKELLYFFIWRDIKVRYKQALLGIAWAIFQPLTNMLVYSFVLGGLAKLPSGGVPYPIFTLCGILIWNYFSKSVINGTNSLIKNANLIRKIYFPRLIIPLASIGVGLFDFFIAFIILLFMMLVYRIPPSINILALPIIIILTSLAALGVSLWTSAISVKYRDIASIIPNLIQILFWLSPVAYGAEAIPERFIFLYSLNPLYTILEGFRWVMLGTPLPPLHIIIISLGIIVILLLSGILYFKRMERQFADVI